MKTIDDTDFARELAVASALARAAGTAALRHYRGNFAVQYKDAGGSDPVTQADKDANGVIVAGLRDAFPNDAVLAEESPPSDDRLGARRLWCVDPIDGTREFIDRNGMFVVMIGLAVEGRARAGVIYQPTEDLLLWGADGHAGAEQGTQRRGLRVSEVTQAPMGRMVVSRSHRSKTVTRIAATLGIARELPLGSVGLKVARIADATADIYISVSGQTREWDACAPEAILRAAGGKMTDICGAPLLYNKESTTTPRGLLATNGLLHDACLGALRPVAHERGWL